MTEGLNAVMTAEAAAVEVVVTADVAAAPVATEVAAAARGVQDTKLRQNKRIK